MRQAPGDEGVLLLVGGVALRLLALRAGAHAPAVVQVDPSYSPARCGKVEEEFIESTSLPESTS